MSERITDALTPDALALALARRRPPQGQVHHSDRGSQYASGDSTTRRYHRHRRHSALGYLSPRAFERGHELDAAAT
jgi:transposase InsO family protein